MAVVKSMIKPSKWVLSLTNFIETPVNKLSLKRDDTILGEMIPF